MAGRIFINYRRGDDPGNTGRLFDRLQESFAPEQLFLDVDNIRPGFDFVRVVEEQIAQCDAILAVIGPRWLDATDTSGNRRLDDPNDFVRIEIESALNQNKRVIPVLVGEARMPRADELPDAIRPMARRHAVRLTHERFRADAQGLVKVLQEALDEAEATRKAEVIRQRPTEGNRKRQAKSKRPQPVESQSLDRPDAASVDLPQTGSRAAFKLLFGFRGRVSRGQFWLGYVLTISALAVALEILNLFGTAFIWDFNGPSFGVAEPVVVSSKLFLGIVLFWLLTALLLKRLHDFGRGWIVCVLLLPFKAIESVFFVNLGGIVLIKERARFDFDRMSAGPLLIVCLIGLLVIGCVVVIGSLRGKKELNRYGPPPEPRSPPALVFSLLWPTSWQGRLICFGSMAILVAAITALTMQRPPLVRTIDAQLDTFDKAQSISFSPDSKWIASGGTAVKVWEADTGRLLRIFKKREATGVDVDAIAFSPDGKWMAVGGSTSDPEIWDAGAGRFMRKLESVHDSSLEWLRGVAFSPDGKVVAAAAGSKIKIWDAQTGQFLMKLSGHRWVESITFSLDGQLIASAGGEDDTVRLWNARTGEVLRTLSATRDRVKSVAFSPDAKWVAAGIHSNYGSSAQIWETATGQLLHTIGDPGGEAVAFSPDGRWLATGTRLWDAGTAQLVRNYGKSYISSLAFSANGQLIALAGQDLIAIFKAQ